MNSKLENLLKLSEYKKILKDSDITESLQESLFSDSPIESDEEKEIINSIQERINSNPTEIKNYLALSDIYLEDSKNSEKALTTLYTALEVAQASTTHDPKTTLSKIYDSLSKAYSKIDNLSIALNYHTKALKLKTNVNPDDFFTQAKLYKQTKQNAKAIKCFNLYIEKKVEEINNKEPNPANRDYGELLGAYKSILAITNPIKHSLIRQDCVEDLKHYLPNNPKAKQLISTYDTTDNTTKTQKQTPPSTPYLN